MLSLDSAVSLSVMCNRLMKEGAKRVFVCASHGHFTPQALEILELSPITQVVISDSIAITRRALAADNSSITTGNEMDLESLDHSTPTTHSITGKVVQVSIAPLLARIIQSDIDASLKSNHLYITGHWSQSSQGQSSKGTHYSYATSDEIAQTSSKNGKQTVHDPPAVSKDESSDDEEFVAEQ